MRKSLVLVLLILAAVLMLSSIAAADPPLRDPMISGKLAEAQRMVDECYRMHKIHRSAAAELHSRINYYREHALNTEIRHGGFIPRHEAIKLNNELDRLLREIETLRDAPPPPMPPPPMPPMR
ncbi:MAG: hypothetical protein HQK97_01540 [Nitrospirae bacterium]|nr:hypothetical protein [Nitrospirota bacterium]